MHPRAQVQRQRLRIKRKVPRVYPATARESALEYELLSQPHELLTPVACFSLVHSSHLALLSRIQVIFVLLQSDLGVVLRSRLRCLRKRVIQTKSGFVLVVALSPVAEPLTTRTLVLRGSQVVQQILIIRLQHRLRYVVHNNWDLVARNLLGVVKGKVLKVHRRVEERVLVEHQRRAEGELLQPLILVEVDFFLKLSVDPV